jgi:dihydrofolate synthase/folylpolyglutamate synthase
MLTLLRALGSPHVGRVTVHVAGSKGKGSICAMIESSLRAGGLRTGLYTSPHLFDYTERIKTGGIDLSRADFARLAGQVRQGAEAVDQQLGERALVTFDLLTAMAFLAFREAAVDVQIVEVGLGGRVDSTNVFDAKAVAVIAPVSPEHTEVLGDTVDEIAAEKAAIITAGSVAVCAPQTDEAARLVAQSFAASHGAEFVDVAAEYSWQIDSAGRRGQTVVIEGSGRALRVSLPLAGRFQAENAATAVAAVDALGRRGTVVADSDIVNGLAKMFWPGRLQVLWDAPLVVADGAHNADSASRLVEALREDFSSDKAIFIVGSLSDKNIDALAAVIAPFAVRVYAVPVAHPRGMPQGRVKAAFSKLGVAAEHVDSVGEAIDNAMAAIDDRGVICLTGSLFLAAEAVKRFKGGDAVT